MTGPIQDADRDVGDGTAAHLGHALDVFRNGGGDVDHVGGVGADGDLLHVEDGRRVEHGAAFGNREHGDRVRHALAHQGGAVHRIHREIAVRTVAVADFLAVVEHRGVVLLALADDDHTAHGNGVDQLAHGVDGGTVALLLFPAADPPARGHGARLGNSDQL
ncbi:Uncharacterised protein [Mycobacteroides abscessus subsp. abscessus]|nr:Uncharacterised protein [Mycobacteroides abscessus subsp. abscessus]